MFRVNLAEYEVTVDAETAENIRGDEEFAEKYLNMLRKQFPGEDVDVQEMEEDSQQQDVGDRQTTTVEAVSDGSSSSKKRKQGFKWSHKIIMLLFDVYRENFRNDNHKVAWQKVAKEMTNQGYVLSWQQCQIKMDTLKRRYKNIKDFEQATGSSPVTWEYYSIMDELFGNKKWANPLAGAVSSTSLVKDATAKIHNPTPGCSKISTPRKKVEENIVKLMNEFCEEQKKRTEVKKKENEEKVRRREEMESGRNKRHREKMEQEKLMDILRQQMKKNGFDRD